MATNSSRVYFVHVLRVTKKKCLNGEKILNTVIVIHVPGLGLYFRFFQRYQSQWLLLPYLLEQINDKWTVSDTQDSKCDFYR